MNQDKWKNTKILAALEERIRVFFVDPGHYSSVMSFVDRAVREHLRRELLAVPGYKPDKKAVEVSS